MTCRDWLLDGKMPAPPFGDEAHIWSASFHLQPFTVCFSQASFVAASCEQHETSFRSRVPSLIMSYKKGITYYAMPVGIPYQKLNCNQTAIKLVLAVPIALLKQQMHKETVLQKDKNK